ncbi:MAG: glycosyltransferase family 2 protein [Oscillospiraceae bacterium]|nr:glycosyltransferase family 2 protein [Oscillospiraceae bacterium]
MQGIKGVPAYQLYELKKKGSEYCLCIPVLNEGDRILHELSRAKAAGIDELVDIIICDGGSNDGSMDPDKLSQLGVNTLIIKVGKGKQGAQLRTGFDLARERGYKGILTIDGNDKDSIESVPRFLEKLTEGFDFIQGSRFVDGGRAINTPVIRLIALKLVHAPVISLAAKQRFTDTTSAFRAYSPKYLFSESTDIFRDVFSGYELLAYLSIRWSELGMRACEVPVTRAYPKNEKTPTKISPIKGNWDLLQILFRAAAGKYNPEDSR